MMEIERSNHKLMPGKTCRITKLSLKVSSPCPYIVRTITWDISLCVQFNPLLR